MLKTYWKRFAEWVINLRTKYREDLFFRTECNIILFQLAFTVFLLTMVIIVFNYFYQDITHTLVTGILESMSHSRIITSSDIFASLETIKTQNFASVIFIFLIVTVLAGYLAARVTLAPARNALAQQKRFVSDIAHELRTPLSIIKTNSEVALLNDRLDPEIKKTLKSNVDELDRTSEIINNLLSFSNLVRPERINFANVDLGNVVDVVVKKMRNLGEKKQIELIVKKKGSHIVWGNNTALEQIVINLVRNAITYTPERGRVTIIVESDNRSDYQKNVLLMVQDTGIGISDKDLFHIFEPFYRAERSRNRQHGSSGLGLTIVSELIKLHAGKITIKSAVDKGTTAIVILPYSKQIPPVKNPTTDLNEISVDFLHQAKQE